MYNRYIGNTGRYYRVDDVDDTMPAPEPESAPEPDPSPTPPNEDQHPLAEVQEAIHEEAVSPPSIEEPEEKKKKLKFEPEKIAKVPENLRGLIKNHMPEGLDLGDILLVLVLLFLFIENDDDEVLIVLIILVFMWVKPLLIKDEDED